LKREDPSNNLKLQNRCGVEGKEEGILISSLIMIYSQQEGYMANEYVGH